MRRNLPDTRNGRFPTLQIAQLQILNTIAAATGCLLGGFIADFFGIKCTVAAAYALTALIVFSGSIVAERMGYADALYLGALIALLVIGRIPFLRAREEPAMPHPAKSAEYRMLEVR